MSTSKSKLQAQETKLKRLIAEGEAELELNRAKLLRVQAQLGGPAAPPSGMDLLWNAAPSAARERSSKFKCMTEWNKIPKVQRPQLVDALTALKLWCKCDQWKKDSGQYIPALDRWIKERRWECPPADTDPNSRYRQAPPKPVAPATGPDAEKVTDRAEIARLLRGES